VGQSVVIENRPGSDAVVAVTAVISANDDHVLLASPTSALTAHPYMLQQMPYQDSDLHAADRARQGDIRSRNLWSDLRGQ
jgi:tripartite-type tricarboxylate transporter receptor subunit TctC